MADQTNGSRVTVRDLYGEVQPMREDISSLKTEMRWVKWGIVLILGGMVSNAITVLGGPTPPEQAQAVFTYLI